MAHKFAERRSIHSKKRLYVWCVVTISLLILVLLALFILTVIKNDMLYDLSIYEATLTKEVSVLGRLKKEEKALQVINEGSQTKLSKIQKLSTIARNTPYKFLVEIADIIPDSIVLTSFSFDTKKIDLEGAADEVQGITHFMRALSQSKLLNSPKLISMNRENNEIIFLIRISKA